MKNIYREAIKKINDSLSLEEKMSNLMLDKLYRCILKRQPKQADLIAKSIKAIFPKTKDVVIFDRKFMAFWKMGQYENAIGAYIKGDRPFWHTQTVGRYYEKKGLTNLAMREYDLLINNYLKMRLLPLPGGPIELYKLGKWHMGKNPGRAKKLLSLYLKAERSTDPAAGRLRYKKQAEQLLNS